MNVNANVKAIQKEKTKQFKNRTLQFARQIDNEYKLLKKNINFYSFCEQVLRETTKFFERIWAILYPLDNETQKLYKQILNEMNIYKVSDSESFKELKNELLLRKIELKEYLDHYEDMQIIEFSNEIDQFKRILDYFTKEDDKLIIGKKMEHFFEKIKCCSTNEKFKNLVENTWINHEKLHYSGSYESLKMKCSWGNEAGSVGIMASSIRKQRPTESSKSIKQPLSLKKELPETISREKSINIITNKPESKEDILDKALIGDSQIKFQRPTLIHLKDTEQMKDKIQIQNDLSVPNQTIPIELVSNIDLSRMSSVSFVPRMTTIDLSRISETPTTILPQIKEILNKPHPIEENNQIDDKNSISSSKSIPILKQLNSIPSNTPPVHPVLTLNLTNTVNPIQPTLNQMNLIPSNIPQVNPIPTLKLKNDMNQPPSSISQTNPTSIIKQIKETREIEIEYMEEDNQTEKDEIEQMIETINQKLISNYKFTNTQLIDQMLNKLYEFF